MRKQAVDLAEKLSLFSEQWSPKVVARLNDYEIKVVKLEGEFVWHTHDDTDELFLVIDGELTIQLRDGNSTSRRGSCSWFPRVSSIARWQTARYTHCSSSRAAS